MVAVWLIIASIFFLAFVFVPGIVTYIIALGFVNAVLTNQFFIGGVVVILLYYIAMKLGLVPPLKKLFKK